MVALVDLATQLLIVVLGMALLFSPDALSAGTSLGTSPTWHSLAFAIPLAMLAYTGLETVANLAEETRRPGRDLPRSLFGSIGLVVVLYVAIAVVGLSAFPAEHGTLLGSNWIRAPLVGIVTQIRQHVPDVIGAPLQVFVGLSGRAHPAHCGDHLHLRLRPTRVLARGARPVTAPVRDAQRRARSSLAAVDHRRRADLDRAPRRNRCARAPRSCFSRASSASASCSPSPPRSSP